MKCAWIKPLFPGLLLGFTVGRLGFADFNELHRMLLFRDLRLLLAFAFAVSLSILLFAILRRRLTLEPVRFHKGTIPGAALFGFGWAVTGVCPGVALIQIGQGIWLALVTLAGIFAGIWIHARLKKRFGLPVSGC
jgi:hypothetical protein